MKYSCICGFETDVKNSYAGHCRHCKQHLISTQKYDKIQKIDKAISKIGQVAQSEKRKQEKKDALSEWISQNNKCKICGKIMTEKFGSGIFCSRSCANTRHHSQETKSKIQNGIVNSNKYNKTIQEKINKYYESPKRCKVCNSIIPYEKKDKKTCGNSNCIKALRSIGGKKGGINSAAKLVKRSKNEIKFCELCENHFGIDDVLHNTVMFNGWDADIILIKEKIAILWNGPWHYRKITEQHNLKQVQNRDKIKIKEIKKCGFTPYIIRDDSVKSSHIIISEFDKLLKYIDN